MQTLVASSKSIDDLDQLKSQLKSLLSEHNGCTKQKDVVEVVGKLAALNPIRKDCSKADLFQGEFYTLTAPPFPGRIENADNLAQFTLGRMSFNIFQPNNLVCTVKSIKNPVVACTSKDDDCNDNNPSASTFEYGVVTDIVIHTTPNDNGEMKEDHDGNGDLEATLINRGFCTPSNDVDNRMMVKFTSSSLIPKDNTRISKAAMDKVLWIRKFANVYEKADRERSYLGWGLYYGLKWFMGLTYPTDMLDEDHGFHYEMKKPMGFYFDVLYLDEDIRITKGSRGTIVVTSRTK